MKKNLILLLSILMLNITASHAATQIKVTAQDEFKTSAPTETISVNVNENVTLGEYNLKQGDILTCKVVQVVEPQRGKRSASFVVQPQGYTSNGVYNAINNEYYGKYSKTVMSVEELKKIPPTTVAKKTALTVGNHFVKGLSTGVYFAEGVVENKGKQPIRSGVKKAYKESPLSYVEKGTDLDIKKGDGFYLIFKISDDNSSNEPNYKYTEQAN